MKPTNLFLSIVMGLCLPACSSESKEEPRQTPAQEVPTKAAPKGMTTADLVLDRVP